MFSLKRLAQQIVLIMITSLGAAKANEVEISSDTHEIEILQGTLVPGHEVEFAGSAVEIIVRLHGVNPDVLKTECRDFKRLIEDGTISAELARSFNPNVPPRFSIIYRPVSPGWGGRWATAYENYPLKDSEQFTFASAEDLRPEVVRAYVEPIIGPGWSEITTQEYEIFSRQLREFLVEAKSEFTRVGEVSFEVNSLTVACDLIQGSPSFKFRFVLKGPTIADRQRALDGIVPASTVREVERIIAKDNNPLGSVNQHLETVLLVRSAENIALNKNSLSLKDIVRLQDFIAIWYEKLGGEFRYLKKKELNELLATLVDEEFRNLFFEHIEENVKLGAIEQ